MKFSMNMLLWSDSVIGDQYIPLFHQVKKMGFDAVEIPIFDPQVEKFAALGKVLDSIGLARTGVTIATSAANPISSDAESRKRAVETLNKTLYCCAAGGLDLVVGPMYAALGEFSGTGRTDEEWKRGLDSMRQVAEHGQRVKVGLSLEYLNRFEIYFLNCAADSARFVKEIDMPGCGSLYDTFHANIEEKNISEAITAISPRLNHVHISENDRSTPGKGSVNWKETFAALKKNKYDGYLTIEAFGLAVPSLATALKIWRKMYETEDQLATDGLAFMKKMWAE